MTERLTKEVEKVRQELQQTRARAVRGELGHLAPHTERQRFSGSGGAGNDVNVLAEEGIQEDDKIFLDKQIIDQAHARLREISVLSPAKEIGNPFDKPSPTQVDGVTFKRPNTAPSSNQQPNRDELTRSQSHSTRKATISNTTAPESNTITQTTSLPADLALSTDDQTSRSQQSPPPHNFIMHAGHTPISVRARIARDSLWSRLASTQSQNASQHHDDELGVVLNKDASPANSKPAPTRRKSPIPNLEGTNDVEGDIPLKSPRMLPTMPSGPSTPNLSQRDDPFAVLASKLEAVANDPKKALPEVLRYTVHVPSDELGVSHGVGGGKMGVGERHDGLGEQKGEHHEVGELEDEKEGDAGDEDDGEEEEEVGDIVVKTRKSLNFGSQLGKLK